MKRPRFALGFALAGALAVLCLAACGPSEEEVDAKIATAVADLSPAANRATATPVVFPTPLPTATPIALPTPLPTATPIALPTPRPTATPIVLPTPAPTATPVTFPTPLPTATPVVFPTPLPTATPFAGNTVDELDAAAVYQQVAGSVLYIETPDGTGTGWAVSGGLIVTNQHVVGEEEAVTVRHAFLPPFRAEVVFTDAVIDVAFISYNPDTTALDPLPTRLVNGDSLGETLLVMGYSSVGVQEDGTVGGAAIKRGVLSQIVSFGEQGGRRLRIDAAVDPGDSGGPVLDGQGHVVGMSKGVVEVDETGRRVVGIFYAVHMEEIEGLLAEYEAGATPP
ncbi:MAG: trypsin-like peptidase domain-containing protein [Chloroflexi bacterium]|nr:trypsin-like peptidase domain-containing protein [Chloroflexota bacterium]